MANMLSFISKVMLLLLLLFFFLFFFGGGGGVKHIFNKMERCILTWQGRLHDQDGGSP